MFGSRITDKKDTNVLNIDGTKDVKDICNMRDEWECGAGSSFGIKKN